MIQTTAKKVQTIIKVKGYKQCAIAKKAGFTQQEFNNILCGRKTFKADYVIPICKALDVSPNELYNFESA